MGSFKDFQLVFELKGDNLKSKKPRKPSIRSSRGCLNCKRKRIKCDEAGTRCQNCVKSRLDCVWPQPIVKSQSKKNNVQQDEFILREPNFGSLSRSPQNSPGNMGSELKKVSFLVNQELSSSRESPHNSDTSNGFGVSLTPTDTNSTDEYFPPNDQGLIVRPPQFFSDSKFFETLSHAFVQTSSCIETLHSNSPDSSDFVEKQDVQVVCSKRCTGEAADILSDFRLVGNRSEMDIRFLSVFINNFLPTLAQVNFQDQQKCSELVIAAAKESALLQEVFIACGASIIAFNQAEYRSMAQERYTKAINYYLSELKLGAIQGGEVWFFVAVQVLQILCLRDMFADSNATRCAAHFGAAYKIISLRLSRNEETKSSAQQFSELEKIMMENFLFNYSITIFFCDHKELPDLVPSPFVFFHQSRAKLVSIFYDSMDRYKYRSMLAFQIAAKCSWSCRLKLPLGEDEKLVHMELIQLAEALLLSFENESDAYGHSNAQVTMSIAKVVLNTSIILISKMIDFDSVRAHRLQHFVKAIRSDINQPYNATTIFPIWSLMIAASTSADDDDQKFFRKCLQDLFHRSNSKIILSILNYLDGLWELYDGDEPFELMFDTDVLDQICN